ncbi:MAG: GspE/PulE family protein [Dehalococcoidia bacterium]|nr:GspE/PulE family protein [Dehalococcoidia bacterium]
MAMALSSKVEKNLGLLLQKGGLITADQWREVLAVYEAGGKDISLILEEQGLVSARELGIIAGMQHNVPFVDLKQQKIEPEALKLIPESMARRYNAIPVAVVEGALMVAMEDPWDLRALDDLTAQARMTVKPVESIPSDIREFIDHSYKVSSQIEQQISSIPKQAPKPNAVSRRVATDLAADTPVVRAVDMIVEQAVKDRASDVHIEAQEDRLRIRYRIDGILHDAMSLPLSVHLSLVSRVKILAGMNIADRRRPQDGQFSTAVEGKKVDIRVATSDTVHGEMVVLRILDKSFALLDLTELGFLPDPLQKYRGMLSAPFGMILLSGPTGSGKTTTLYSSVNQLNHDEQHIVTIEDPVEYRFNNINQIQVNPSAGITFANGLRALMRLDPDVILVGEIRDRETAEIAIQASLTGHIVMSSIHANDSVGALFRLLDLGIEPFLICSSIIGVVAQRMVRRVCNHCRRPVPGSLEEQAVYEREMGAKRTEFFYGQGCNFCANTGYRGRCGVFEILAMSEETRRMVLSGASAGTIRARALQEGMAPMLRDGMLKVKQSVTSPYEVLRNVYSIAQGS